MPREIRRYSYDAIVIDVIPQTIAGTLWKIVTKGRPQTGGILMTTSEAIALAEVLNRETKEIDPLYYQFAEARLKVETVSEP